VLTGAKHITLGGARAYVSTPDKVVFLDLDDPLKPRVMATIPFNGPRATALQFRYLFVTDKDGFHVVDVTDPEKPVKVERASVSLLDAGHLYLARTYAYVAGGAEGLVIVDIEKPETPKVYMRFTDDGKMTDVRDVKVASTNASLFAYVADGKNGLKVLQLTDPDRVPAYYGFSPEVQPEVIAHHQTHGPALAISRALDRDRAADETGHQVSVMGRIGSRPFSEEEMRKMYLTKEGKVFTVKN